MDSLNSPRGRNQERSIETKRKIYRKRELEREKNEGEREKKNDRVEKKIGGRDTDMMKDTREDIAEELQKKEWEDTCEKQLQKLEERQQVRYRVFVKKIKNSQCQKNEVRQ